MRGGGARAGREQEGYSGSRRRHLYHFLCVLLCHIQAKSKFSQIQQNLAKPEQNQSKKKAWIFLDFLVGFEPFQWVAPTPPGKKFLFPLLSRSLASGGGQASFGDRTKVPRILIFAREFGANECGTVFHDPCAAKTRHALLICALASTSSQNGPRSRAENQVQEFRDGRKADEAAVAFDQAAGLVNASDWCTEMPAVTPSAAAQLTL